MEKNNNIFILFVGVVLGAAGAIYYKENQQKIDSKVGEIVDQTKSRLQETKSNIQDTTAHLAERASGKLGELGEKVKTQADNMENSSRK